MGYGACVLASALAHVYLLGREIGFKRGEPEFYRSIARMTYGTLCFALLFSLVGTITGGIWANESWGRFWGWDPKENGALMIVLWLLIALHARLGGFIRDLGIASTAIISGIIMAFAWWGVNQLNVGLHSYGFTSGVVVRLIVFCSLEFLIAEIAIRAQGGSLTIANTEGEETVLVIDLPSPG